VSIVPNQILKSSDSLELITFEIKKTIDAATFTIDIFNEHLSFWKSLVIRNHQIGTSIFYRTRTSGPFQELQPQSERPVKGWGSWFEATSAAGTPDGEIDFICVRKEHALR